MSTAGTWTGPRRLTRVYGGLLRVELQAAAAYRSQLVLGALSWVVPVAFMALWKGAAASGPVNGIGSAQFTTYFAVVLLTTALQLSRQLAFGIEPLVHTGELSALLLRPHHAMHALVARGLAGLTYRLPPLVLVVPLLVLGLGGSLTHRPGQLLLGGLLVPLGFVAEVYLALMLGSVALWVTRAGALTGLLFGAEWVLGGLVAPVALLPGILPGLLRHQPLWFAIGAPGEAASGISTLGVGTLAEAVGWVVVLHLLYRRLWRAGLRRYEAVGT